MRTRSLTIVLLLLAFGEPGCNNSESSDPVNAIDVDPLQGTSWILIRVAEPFGGPTVWEPPPNEEYGVDFEPGGTAVVRIGCNSCDGKYWVIEHPGEWVQRTLTISLGSCTDIACDPPVGYSECIDDLDGSGHWLFLWEEKLILGVKTGSYLDYVFGRR